ncbi:hypothetical protein OP862_07010 [Yersinia massiliensis]|uniref:Lipoprotein n=1 Tax=Yersinia massiliensis TaxID=419257 RepID=A0AA90XUM2_9GAMM|nr:hypothetical protein [Yersinia massiliensis]MDA5546261.1 hypothetical protein [Yersinia massiliensis]NIL27268.1 hypothetical protein [Yersinia massiliensis]UZM80388.1 hypothetical protein OP862_07010 [Yersinia massiliensis]
MKKHSLAIFAALVLSGCATKWEPLNNPTLTLQEAKKLCHEKAQAQYPVRNEVATRSVQQPTYIKCNKKDDGCSSSGYKSDKVLGFESYAMDVNEDSRNSMFLACMETNGWKKPNWLDAYL